jgi:2-C-methyl-D-erythritol 4-phosphate cytidylyltransferase
MKTVALVVAGGRGTRMKGAIPKQFLRLGRLPLLIYPLSLLQRVREVSGVVLVVPRGFVSRALALVGKHGLSKLFEVTVGGKERQDSVLLGLRTLSPDTKFVLIHDAARPCPSPRLIKGSIRLARESKDGVLTAIPVSDTLKRVKQGFVLETLDRQDLWRAQTPQVFPYPLILAAYERAARKGFRATDDTAVYQWAGGKVRVYPGEETNLKVTTRQDLHLAKVLLKAQG